MSLRTHRVTLGALALMLFCFLTSEVFVAGALLPMSRDLGAPPAAVGALVSSYAVVAAVAILPMTALTTRVPTRAVLVAGLVVLAVAQLVVAAAPSLGWVVAARAVTALFHGPVWASAPVLAAVLAPERPASATAAVFLGGSAANLAGAPLVAVLSDLTSWRVAAALLAFTFVSDDALAAGLAEHHLGLLLLAMGLAGGAGTLLMGRVADAHPRSSLLAALAVMATGLALTAAAGAAFVGGAVAWALAYAALVAVLPARVVQTAPGWAERASAWYVLAFQIGIAGGAALGGWAPHGTDAHVTRAMIGAALTLSAALPLWTLLNGRSAARR